MMVISARRAYRHSLWQVVASYPAKPLEVFEFQGCPFCKRVREALITLDLDAVFYPCPRDGPNFRPQANAEGGKKMFRASTRLCYAYMSRPACAC